jgi:hypothetical protein
MSEDSIEVDSRIDPFPQADIEKFVNDVVDAPQVCFWFPNTVLSLPPSPPLPTITSALYNALTAI